MAGRSTTPGVELEQQSQPAVFGCGLGSVRTHDKQKPFHQMGALLALLRLPTSSQEQHTSSRHPTESREASGSVLLAPRFSFFFHGVNTRQNHSGQWLRIYYDVWARWSRVRGMSRALHRVFQCNMGATVYYDGVDQDGVCMAGNQITIGDTGQHQQASAPGRHG